MILLQNAAFLPMFRSAMAERGRLENPIRITHQEIAAELGSSREVISRILENLARQGIIRVLRGSIETKQELCRRHVADIGEQPSASEQHLAHEDEVVAAGASAVILITPAADPFFPLIFASLPPNTDNLVDVENDMIVKFRVHLKVTFVLE